MQQAFWDFFGFVGFFVQKVYDKFFCKGMVGFYEIFRLVRVDIQVEEIVGVFQVFFRIKFCFYDFFVEWINGENYIEGQFFWYGQVEMGQMVCFVIVVIKFKMVVFFFGVVIIVFGYNCYIVIVIDQDFQEVLVKVEILRCDYCLLKQF